MLWVGGNTPLCLAAKFGKKEVVQILLEAGPFTANISAPLVPFRTSPTGTGDLTPESVGKSPAPHCHLLALECGTLGADTEGGKWLVECFLGLVMRETHTSKGQGSLHTVADTLTPLPGPGRGDLTTVTGFTSH